jgi:hypothetical protein
LFVNNQQDNIDIFVKDKDHGYKRQSFIDIAHKGMVSSVYLDDCFVIGCRDGTLLEICGKKLVIQK